jgi:hypothetical protein
VFQKNAFQSRIRRLNALRDNESSGVIRGAIDCARCPPPLSLSLSLSLMPSRKRYFDQIPQRFPDRETTDSATLDYSRIIEARVITKLGSSRSIPRRNLSRNRDPDGGANVTSVTSMFAACFATCKEYSARGVSDEQVA